MFKAGQPRPVNSARVGAASPAAVATNKKMTRNQVRQLVAQETNGKDKLKFTLFLKTVLDFQLREHEKFLSRFSVEFRAVDTNNDGVIDENQFRVLMKRLRVVPLELIEKFLQDIDPFNN
jgi:Ca2+-binding EF-hand superfamily protein